MMHETNDTNDKHDDPAGIITRQANVLHSHIYVRLWHEDEEENHNADNIRREGGGGQTSI